MRPQSRFTARAARSIALCLAVLSRGCGGSTPPPAEVDLGRAPGDPEPPTAEQPNAAARAERAKSRRSPVSQEPADPTEEPGYLTLVCDPACDDVSYEGRSLGPSPVVRAPLAPGSRRITVSHGGSGHKIITVILRSGQVHAVRVAMGGGAAPPPPQTAATPGSNPTQAGAPGPMSASSQPTPAMIQMRAQLEPKAWAGNATPDELKLLRALCSYIGDRACRDRAAALLKAQPQAPSSSSP
jgi:hypothetical protein